MQAQADSSAVKHRIKITEVYVQTGFVAHNKAVNTLDDFRKLAPQSTLLDSNFNGYSSHSNAFTNNVGFAFSTLVGINFLNHQKTNYNSNPQLRLGISYMSGISMSRSLRKEDTKPYDTLTSSQTGEIILIDSVSTNHFNMQYNNEQLRLHASLIFRTNPKARWSLYTGAGITAGMSFNAHTQIGFSHSNSTTVNNSGNYYGDTYGSYDQTTEDFINKNSFGFSAFIPLGVDWRVARKREFWKRLHLYCELGEQIDFSTVPELRTYTSSGITFSLGLRVTVD